MVCGKWPHASAQIHDAMKALGMSSDRGSCECTGLCVGALACPHLAARSGGMTSPALLSSSSQTHAQLRSRPLPGMMSRQWETPAWAARAATRLPNMKLGANVINYRGRKPPATCRKRALRYGDSQRARVDCRKGYHFGEKRGRGLKTQ